MNSENERIRAVYSTRDATGRSTLYAWHRPEVRQQEADKQYVATSLLGRSFGTDLSGIRVCDVGCGTGGFIRSLIEWGAAPENIMGTEFLPDRLGIARQISAPGVVWHLGGLESTATGSFDLVSANTVFSSILDAESRKTLAQEMWRVTKPGGWVLVFDFRYNNPANSDVKKVTQRELKNYFAQGVNEYYQTLLLAPPIARILMPTSHLAANILTTLFPFLRSHFLLHASKAIVSIIKTHKLYSS